MINELQKELRYAYVSGGTGVVISGIVWITAGLVAFFLSSFISLFVFFIGGMFIYPLSMIFSKLLQRPGKHEKSNVLGRLALEGTAVLFLGLFVSFLLYHFNPSLFYPVMLLSIGVRYLIFQSLYGLKSYWILGFILILSGMLGVFIHPDVFIMAILGGVIEIVAGLFILKTDLKED
jgi:hypothetical protein